MLKVTTHRPFLHSVSASDLPDILADEARAVSQLNSYRMLNYSDGDYYFAADLQLVNRDTTPDTVLEAILEGKQAKSSYPYDWSKELPERTTLYQYIQWLKLMRFLQENLPPDIFEENRLAIHFSH